MFSKTVVASSKFLRMPATSRLLYFDLGMAADDDGYCEWYPVVQMTGAKEQDLEVLRMNGFVFIFDREVLVIKDWKENNFIRTDRYQPSKYLGKYEDSVNLPAPQNEENTSAEGSGIPKVNQRYTQVRLGKVRKGNTIATQSVAKEVASLIKAFEQVNPSFAKWYGHKTQRAAAERLLKTHGLENVLKVVGLLPSTNGLAYFPTITTPVQLEDKWASLEAALKRRGDTQTKQQIFV